MYFRARFFDHVIVLCNGNSNNKEGPFGYFVMQAIARHHRRSHVKYNGKFLGPAQKGAVSRAVQNNPNCTGSMVMRNLVSIPDDVIYIDPGLKESVDRFVRAERDVVLSRNLGGMSVGGNKHNEVHKLKNVL